MEKRRIGPLDVSVVGLGCNNFGWRLDETATAAVVDAALGAGINFFDTADIYGGTKSEEFLGRAIRHRRDDVIVATKFGGRIDDQRKGARPAYVRQAVDASLRRLDLDRIDLYQLHMPDPEVPIVETLGALDDLVRAGKLREIGCSNFSLPQLQEADAAAGQGRGRFISLQNEYSLLRRDPEQGVLAGCERRGIAFLPYFPLASGLLTGKYRRGEPAAAGTRIAEAAAYFAPLLNDRNFAVVEGLTAFAEARGRTILELAVSWLLARPVVASVIAGATSPEQVRMNALAGAWRLAPAELAEIDTIAAQPA